ncbi:chromogranin-A-like [Salvia splendens]|uniref:chromogranin-A-like n=1 Tax=Salvia splendens TaxID=180675 RepID=UPI001C25E18C|nr:chromogranin-A-like [Salvia splendens]
MGKKKWAKKQTGAKTPSTRREETPESHPPTEERPPNPQLQEQNPQAPVMFPLDIMAEFLRKQDPHRDWAAELANFSRIGRQEGVTGETPAVPAAEPNAQPTVQPPTSIPTSSTTHPERESPSATTPSEPSEPSPTQEQSNSMEVDPISAYYDSDLGEREERRIREQESREGRDEPERTSLAETNPQEIARE